MQCTPVLQSLIPDQGVWNSKSQPGHRGSRVPARVAGAELGSGLYRTLLGENQTGRPWKWVIPMSQKRDMERPLKTSEVIFKNIFPFAACMLGGIDGDRSQDLQAFMCRRLFLKSHSVRHHCADSAGRYVLLLGDLGMFSVWMWLFVEVLWFLCQYYRFLLVAGCGEHPRRESPRLSGEGGS